MYNTWIYCVRFVVVIIMILAPIRIIEVKLIGSLDLCLCQRQLYRTNGLYVEIAYLEVNVKSSYRGDACIRAKTMKR